MREFERAFRGSEGERRELLQILAVSEAERSQRRHAVDRRGQLGQVHARKVEMFQTRRKRLLTPRPHVFRAATKVVQDVVSAAPIMLLAD